MHDKYHARGLNIYTVSYSDDYAEDVETMKDCKFKHTMVNDPVACDPRYYGFDDDFVDQHIYVIDPDGKVIAEFMEDNIPKDDKLIESWLKDVIPSKAPKDLTPALASAGKLYDARQFAKALAEAEKAESAKDASEDDKKAAAALKNLVSRQIDNARARLKKHREAKNYDELLVLFALYAERFKGHALAKEMEELRAVSAKEDAYKAAEKKAAAAKEAWEKIRRGIKAPGNDQDTDEDDMDAGDDDDDAEDETAPKGDKKSDKEEEFSTYSESA